jgi:hypothetical protein
MRNVAHANSHSQFNRLTIDPIYKNFFSSIPRAYPPKTYTFKVERPSPIMTQTLEARQAPHPAHSHATLPSYYKRYFYYFN